MASTYMTAGGAGANLTVKQWKRKLEPGLYDKMRGLPKFKETAETGGIMNQLAIRRLGRIAGQTLTGSNDGTNFDFQDLAPTVVTIDPVWLICPAAWPDSAPRRMGMEVKAGFRKNVEDALSSALEYYALSVATLTTSTPLGNAAYNINAAGFRGLVRDIATDSKMNVEPGDAGMYVILDTSQIDSCLDIPEIGQAYQGAGGKSPIVSGITSLGAGWKVLFSTLCTADANGKNGLAWADDAIQYGYNKRPDIEDQRYLKQNRIMADAEIGVSVIYNEKCKAVRTA